MRFHDRSPTTYTKITTPEARHVAPRLINSLVMEEALLELPVGIVSASIARREDKQKLGDDTPKVKSNPYVSFVVDRLHHEATQLVEPGHTPLARTGFGTQHTKVAYTLHTLVRRNDSIVAAWAHQLGEKTKHKLKKKLRVPTFRRIIRLFLQIHNVTEDQLLSSVNVCEAGIFDNPESNTRKDPVLFEQAKLARLCVAMLSAALFHEHKAATATLQLMRRLSIYLRPANSHQPTLRRGTAYRNEFNKRIGEYRLLDRYKHLPAPQWAMLFSPICATADNYQQLYDLRQSLFHDLHRDLKTWATSTGHAHFTHQLALQRCAWCALDPWGINEHVANGGGVRSYQLPWTKKEEKLVREHLENYGRTTSEVAEAAELVHRPHHAVAAYCSIRHWWGIPAA
ncbi:hypothetical protein C8R46DRAFT_1239622 [Mycena filopes]|nr:hypothetical protein C8R46DRAFT_1239622 [Mycena filopes]